MGGTLSVILSYKLNAPLLQWRPAPCLNSTPLQTFNSSILLYSHLMDQGDHGSTLARELGEQRFVKSYQDLPQLLAVPCFSWACQAKPNSYGGWKQASVRITVGPLCRLRQSMLTFVSSAVIKEFYMKC